ncbi:hypothetical protein [Agromyces humi]|uniref:hypothetical protein n=1 Tax=Agromyces humi TaxID=1766800 RepID=UPI00135A6CE1|nr:hypothetical protein [Agromyces humi]
MSWAEFQKQHDLPGTAIAPKRSKIDLEEFYNTATTFERRLRIAAGLEAATLREQNALLQGQVDAIITNIDDRPLWKRISEQRKQLRVSNMWRGIHERARDDLRDRLTDLERRHATLIGAVTDWRARHANHAGHAALSDLDLALEAAQPAQKDSR